jgi:hypothetical protein
MAAHTGDVEVAAMQDTLSLTKVMVTLSGPHRSRQTIGEALRAVSVDDVEVTWRNDAGDRVGRIAAASGGATLEDISRRIVEGLDPDVPAGRARQAAGLSRMPSRCGSGSGFGWPAGGPGTAVQ